MCFEKGWRGIDEANAVTDAVSTPHDDITALDITKKN